MNTRLWDHTEFKDNAVVVCEDAGLNNYLNQFLKFIDMSYEEMSADKLVESIPGLRDKKMSMIIFEGKENIKTIMNKRYLLRRDHPDMQFIILLDEPAESETVSEDKNFQDVKFLHKKDVLQKISLFLGYVYSSKKYSGAPNSKAYAKNISDHHRVDMYV
ncbi:MAG: hypothetical protein WCI84_03525 [Bacteroidota bacterium]